MPWPSIAIVSMPWFDCDLIDRRCRRLLCPYFVHILHPVVLYYINVKSHFSIHFLEHLRKKKQKINFPFENVVCPTVLSGCQARPDWIIVCDDVSHLFSGYKKKKLGGILEKWSTTIKEVRWKQQNKQQQQKKGSQTARLLGCQTGAMSILTLARNL